MKTIAITGPTGAIGMALIKKCIEEGVKVLAFVRPDSARLDRIPDNPLVVKVMCGLDDLEGFEPESLECDAFYHFAWAGAFGDGRNNMPMQENNAKCVLDAVRLAKRMNAKVFIGAGSQAEYGRVEGMLTAETPTNPENGYGIYKLQAGNESRTLCAELGLVHIWTRILSVYGPYDGSYSMIMSTIAKLLRGEKPPLTKGEQIWDFLYSDDAAKAMFLLGQAGCKEYDEKHGADSGISKSSELEISEQEDSKFENIKNKPDENEFGDVDGNIYVIGSGIGKPLCEYIEVMRDAVNPTLPLGFGEVPYGPKQVMHLQADISDLKRDTGFEAEVDFAEGIRRTVKYVKDNLA